MEIFRPAPKIGSNIPYLYPVLGVLGVITAVVIAAQWILTGQIHDVLIFGTLIGAAWGTTLVIRQYILPQLSAIRITEQGLSGYNGWGWPIKITWAQMGRVMVTRENVYMMRGPKSLMTIMFRALTVPKRQEDLLRFARSAQDYAPADHDFRKFCAFIIEEVK